MDRGGTAGGASGGGGDVGQTRRLLTLRERLALRAFGREERRVVRSDRNLAIEGEPNERKAVIPVVRVELLAIVLCSKAFALLQRHRYVSEHVKALTRCLREADQGT